MKKVQRYVASALTQSIRRATFELSGHQDEVLLYQVKPRNWSYEYTIAL